VFYTDAGVVASRSGGKGSTGDLAPGLEGTITGSAMAGSQDTMATELKEVVDWSVVGEKLLGLLRRLEPLHLPFASLRRLM
jgi:hypothetical protein